MFCSILFAQKPILEVKGLSELNLSNYGQVQLQKIQQSNLILGYWLTKFNPIENYLIDGNLSIKLPDTGIDMLFTTDIVKSENNGDYYWTGYNTNGNTIRIQKSSSGYFGNVHIATNNTDYGIIPLGGDNTAWVKYDPTRNVRSGECSSTDNSDVSDNEPKGEGCTTKNIRILFLFTSAANATFFTPATTATTIINELNTSSIGSGLTSAIIFNNSNSLNYETIEKKFHFC